MSKRPQGVIAKIAAIQRSKIEVELTDASGEDAFEFMAAADVFAKVKSKLGYHKLGFLTEAVSFEPGPPARARVRVTVFDAEEYEQDFPDEVALEWEGEADKDSKRPGGSARTNALKAFWVALFQIQPKQKPPEDRREERQQKVRRQPKKATAPQINFRIVQPASERGIDGDRLLEMANELLPDGHAIEAIKDLPASHVDRLHNEIMKVPKR